MFGLKSSERGHAHARTPARARARAHCGRLSPFPPATCALQEEFAKCIALCKLDLSAEQVAKVHGYFDRDHSGQINFTEFLHAIRDRLSPPRRKLVVQAFHGLDAMGNGDGVLTVEDLVPLYDPSKHPDVVAGRMDSSTALRVFLDGFEGAQGDRDSTVTLDEWIAYYEDVSASIDSEERSADKDLKKMTGDAKRKMDGATHRIASHFSNHRSGLRPQLLNT